MRTLFKHTNNDTDLVFINSACINVYPCGRRRAVKLDNGEVVGSIPFDPESKLSTERNLRKLTAINGYTNTYIYNANDESLDFVIDGYLFKINLAAALEYLEPEKVSLNSFGSELWALFNDDAEAEQGQSICAKIKLQEVPLVDMGDSVEFVKYNTVILGNQYSTVSDESIGIDAALDIKLLENQTVQDPNDAGLIIVTDHHTNYVFTGLSFVVLPTDDFNDSDLGLVNPFIKSNDSTEITLRLLNYTGAGWCACQEALLPKVLHGSVENSIRMLGELAIDENLTVQQQTFLNELNTSGTTRLGNDPGTTVEVNGPTTFNESVAVVAGHKLTANGGINTSTIKVDGEAEVDGNLAAGGDVIADGKVISAGDTISKGEIYAGKALHVNMAESGYVEFGDYTLNDDGTFEKNAELPAGLITRSVDNVILAQFGQVDGGRVRTTKDGKLEEVATVSVQQFGGQTYKLVIK